MIQAARAGVLDVPGAALYYKMLGTGPLLLLLQGGAGDADASDGMAERLADAFTVVTYDRRGMARSPLTAPETRLRMETESSDVVRLIDALAGEPAFVFGSSAGALIGLDTVARHPDRVALLVAHEPPAPYLLRERVNVGTPATLEEFAVRLGVNPGDREHQAAAVRPTPEAGLNAVRFLRHEQGMIRRYRLDVGALRRVADQVVVAFGRDGRDHWPARSAFALAALLPVQLVEFPGDHAGYAHQPKEFAVRLRDVLTADRSVSAATDPH